MATNNQPQDTGILCGGGCILLARHPGGCRAETLDFPTSPVPEEAQLTDEEINTQYIEGHADRDSWILTRDGKQWDIKATNVFIRSRVAYAATEKAVAYIRETEVEPSHALNKEQAALILEQNTEAKRLGAVIEAGDAALDAGERLHQENIKQGLILERQVDQLQEQLDAADKVQTFHQQDVDTLVEQRDTALKQVWALVEAGERAANVRTQIEARRIMLKALTASKEGLDAD